MKPKLVLIGSENADYTTTLVCRWIERLGHNFIRLNEEDKLHIKSVSVSNGGIDATFKSGSRVFNLSEIYSFWFRRGGLGIDIAYPEFESSFPANDTTKRLLMKFVQNEHLRIESFYKYLLEFNTNIKLLGNPTNYVNNKLIHLSMASEVGMRIPDTYIVSTRNQINKILKKHPRLLLKAISDSTHFQNGFVSDHYNTYTLYGNIIENHNVKALPQEFLPSLLQENIEKEFELRIFYMNNRYYAMAIFSQTDAKTVVDFRRYNFAKPNRGVPFVIPQDLENKLDRLFVKCGLNTGSVDILVSTKSEYVFLEINPAGQFGMVSYPCNYQLEKIVAEYLTC
jgi:ATP-GRASP peptide maturase of grasp-with-spasm system